MNWIAVLLLGVLAGCQVVGKPPVTAVAQDAALAPGLPEWQSPREREHKRVGQIIDLRTGAQISPAQLLTELAAAPVVLLGEKHDNPDHHALQLWLLQALGGQRAQGSVVLEMLTVNQQPTVSAVQKQVRAGEIPKDLPLALEWHQGWDWQQYGDLVSYILAQPYPLLAGNLDRTALMSIYRDPPVLTGLQSTGTEVTERLHAHIREAHCNKLPEAQLPAMLAVQQQRDRSMAQVILSAAQPTILLAGAYHVRYDLGVPLHLADLQDTAELSQRVLVFAEADQVIEAKSADFVWYTPAVAEQDYCADLQGE